MHTKSLLITFLFYCTHCMLQSQTKYTPQDSIDIYALLDLADALDFKGKIDSAFNTVEKARLLSRDKTFKRGEGFALLKFADLTLKSKGTILEVISKLQRGISIGDQIKDYFITGLGKHQYSQFYRDKSAWDSCIFYLTKAIEDYEKADLDDYIAYAYNDIGYALDKKGDFENAINHYYQAIPLFEKFDVKKEIANSLNNIATVYNRMNKREDAIKIFKQSISVAESIQDIRRLAAAYGNLAMTYSYFSLDSAVFYQKKAVQLAEKTNELSIMAQANANTATLFARTKKYSEAIVYDQKAIELFTKIGDRNKLAARNISLALNYHLNHDSLAAEKAFHTAENLVFELDTKPLLQAFHEEKSRFYIEHCNYKNGLEHLQLSTKYKDSILNEKSLANVAEIQTKYDVAKKDHEIFALQAYQKIKQAELKQQKTLLINKTLETDLQKNKITVLEQEGELNEIKLKDQQSELYRIENEKKLNEEIAKKEQLLSHQKIQSTRLSRNLILGTSIMVLLTGLLLFNRYQLKQRLKAQQKVLAIRNAISKDLHDEIGSTLTSISMLSKVSEKSYEVKPELVKENLLKITNQSKIIQQNISDIVWSIRPDTAPAISLISRIREFGSDLMEAADIQFSIQDDPEISSTSLSELQRKEMLLIIKEALNNIVKHAQASVVRITSTLKSGILQINISDNGQWKENKISSGLGLTSMTERAKKINGELYIQKSELGTVVSLKVPV